jgi:uncharacterized membrane protein YhaH (DUF805 family)
MFKNPFSFKGRIRRTEFGLSSLIYYLIIYTPDFMGISEEDYAIPYLVILVPLIWFFLAQGAKRCHDRGNSGWYQIIPFYSLWMLFADSDFGPNEYGDNPKGQGNYDAIEEIGKQIENQ